MFEPSLFFTAPQEPLLEDMVVYEYPLNEKIRTWLRFNRLFRRFHNTLNAQFDESNHLALITLFEIIDMAERGDVKNDLLQELDRQRIGYRSLLSHEAVEKSTLEQMMASIDTLIKEVRAVPGRLGQNLRSNPWLSLMRSRMGVPGGICEFDVPSYHWWSHQNLDKIHDDIESFYFLMRPTEKAIDFILQSIRSSVEPETYVFREGALSSHNHRFVALLRMFFDKSAHYYPEVSANRFQINIRVLSLPALVGLDGPAKGIEASSDTVNFLELWEQKQIRETISLKLSFCIMPAAMIEIS